MTSLILFTFLMHVPGFIWHGRSVCLVQFFLSAFIFLYQYVIKCTSEKINKKINVSASALQPPASILEHYAHFLQSIKFMDKI